MRYLLDTNIFIYAANEKELLSRDRNPSNIAN